MAIYAIGGIKGGVGKTTISVNFLAYLIQKERDVLLIDADEQETATDFTAWRDHTLEGRVGYTTVKLTGDSIRREVPKLKEKYNDIIIDTGGRDTTSQRAALIVADIYLLPFQPRSMDFWTITKVQNLLDEIRSVKPTELKAFAFLNRADIRSADNRDTANALSQIKEVEFISMLISNRKCFSNAAAKGLSVYEYEPKDEKAITELSSLFNEIFKKSN
jgi:chromosome partitioning protein